MSGQDRAGQVVEARSGSPCTVALPMPLRIVVAVADHRGAVTGRAANAIGPAMLADQLVALGVIDQRR